MEKPKRILVIDDDIDLLMLLERRLDREGYCVETACSIAEAKALIPIVQPHLVLLDVNINGEDGRQLCFELKTDPSLEMKVILISGHDPNPRRAQLFKADDMLPKPFDTAILVSKIDDYLMPKVKKVV
jgi:DNA-binding response OmpR family regulator